MNSKEKIEEVLKEYHFTSYPEEYKNILTKFLDLSKTIFKDNLLSITLGGSGGKNKLIKGWSDLDIYVLLNKYDIEQVSTLQKILQNNDIHIGLTLYNLDEINNGFIDFKTKIMLYEKYNYQVNPTLYGLDYYKCITYEEVYENDRVNYPHILQAFKRMYIEVINNERKIDKPYIKKMVVLLKCILNLNNTFTYGYNTVYQEFIKLTDYRGPIINFEESIKDLENNQEYFTMFSQEIINYTENKNMYKVDIKPSMKKLSMVAI